MAKKRFEEAFGTSSGQDANDPILAHLSKCRFSNFDLIETQDDATHRDWSSLALVRRWPELPASAARSLLLPAPAVELKITEFGHARNMFMRLC